eukprot:10008906-Ditylum_brightwellii.AAC.1
MKIERRNCRTYTTNYLERRKERNTGDYGHSQQRENKQVQLLRVEKPIFIHDGQSTLDNKGLQRMHTEEALARLEVEEACMHKVEGQCRMSEKSPTMVTPLVHYLEYSGATDDTDKMLAGNVWTLSGIGEYIQAYLYQLQYIEGHVPEPAKPILFPTYIGEVKRLRERTLSGPSNVTPAMVKTKAVDPYISRINWHASNFTWCARVSKLRPILLFDMEANIHNKRSGREAVEKAEKSGGIAPEQYGSRKRLFYSYILLERTPTASTFIDLVSNYELAVHSIASLVLQRVGMPKEPIQFTFITLQDMVHMCRTTFGNSTSSYQGNIWAILCKPPPQGLDQGNGVTPCIWAL